MAQPHIQPLVFIGASTAFSEINGLIRDINREKETYDVVAIVDDNSALHGHQLEGVSVIGSLECVHQYPNAKFVFGIGSFRNRIVRYEILKRLNVADDRFVTLIHPSCNIYPGTRVGPGSIVHAGVVIGGGAVLEPFAIVTFNSVIGSYVRMGRCAMVTTMVVVLTGVQIGPCSFIGAQSCLAENIKIGPGAMIGMGSCVYRDVPAGAFVLGNPAKKVYTINVPQELENLWQEEKI